MAKPIILSFYNNVMDADFSNYQKLIVDKFNISKIPFISEEVKIWSQFSYLHHGDILNIMLREYINNYQYDTFIILDVDCFPLSYTVFDTAIEIANHGKIVGNKQRYNRRYCVNESILIDLKLDYISEENLPYVGPSFMCFTRELYLDLACPSFGNCTGNKRFLDEFSYDTGEAVSLAARKNNIELVFFTPKTSIINEKWHLGDPNITYGVGTTFEFNNEEVTFHNFNSRLNYHDYNSVFVNKAKEILEQNESGINY